MASKKIKPIDSEALAQKLVACDKRQTVLDAIKHLNELGEEIVQKWNRGEINDADKDAKIGSFRVEIQKLLDEGEKGFKYFG